MAAKGTNGAIPGGACTVTEGPNAGKSGTYTVDDEGNIWCEGPWGGTECHTRCEDAVGAQGTVYEYEDTDGETVYEFDDVYEVDGMGIFRCKSRLEAKTGAARYVAVTPVTVTPLAGLQQSESQINRQLASAILSHVKARVKGNT